MQRGEIYFAELNPVMGCEFGGQQPVVICLLYTSPSPRDA